MLAHSTVKPFDIFSAMAQTTSKNIAAASKRYEDRAVVIAYSFSFVPVCPRWQGLDKGRMMVT